MPKDEPVHLKSDEGSGDLFLLHTTQRGIRLDIRFQDETLWMTQEQMSQLFGRDRTVITKHIGNILAEGELDEATSVQKMHISHGRPANLYNLDMAISVGYRVSSRQATLFRRWATGILVQYAKKGFVIDADRLKSDDEADRIAELREIIRDIRADEANVYRELKRICTLCQDYDPKSDAATGFFQQTQAKLIYAVVSRTPSEIITTRANAEQPNMGLQTWPKDQIRKQDTLVSKNYLSESEIRELNRLTTILLDIFEDQVDIGRLVLMEDATHLLERQLKGLERAVLKHGGSVSATDAKAHAERQYRLYDEQRKAARHGEADKAISELAKEAKRLPGKK